MKVKKTEPIEWLKKLISIPSISKEEKKATDYFESIINGLGYKPQRVGNNLLVSGKHYSPIKKNILLNSHIDTVKPSNQWTFDPFTPVLKEEKLYGLGSNDAGASLVTLLSVFTQVDNPNNTYNYFYSVSAEEEITGETGFVKLLPILPEIDLAIVGEPTNMKIAIAEKGLMVVDGYATGKSGHAARNEGINAIYEAMKDIEIIKTIYFSKQSNLLGKVKCTITQIEAGKQHNIIPDVCKFTIDIRTNEYYSNQEIFSILQEKTHCELIARSFRLNSTQSPIEHPIVKKTQKHKIPSFGSPTLSDQCIMPFPSIKMGVGDSARSHTSDEFIYLSEIEEATNIYINILS